MKHENKGSDALKKKQANTATSREKTNTDNEKFTRVLYSSAFLGSLILYIAICSSMIIAKYKYENLAATITAITLCASLFVRAIFPNSSNKILNFVKISGDWVAVTFTLSTILKPLEFSPWLIIILIILISFFAAIAFLREK